MERETKLFIGGLIIAAAGYFIPLYFGHIWLGLFIALVTAVIFLGRLLSLGKEEVESAAAYRVVYGLIVLVVAFNALAFARDYGMRDYQKDLLLEIRKTIETGITRADVQEKMIYVLGHYHRNNRESVVETFKELMGDHLGENGVYLSDFDLNPVRKAASGSDLSDEDTINYFYKTDAEKDEVKVIVVSEIAPGSNAEYENFDGQTGRLEMMFTLNKEGVGYEVLN